MRGVGDRVGPYVLERRLGSGGFGTVWIGRHSLTDVRHALKLVPLHEPEVAARVAREVEALARLGSHPGLVQVHGCFREEGTSVIVMDLVEGRELAAFLRAKGALRHEDGARVVRDVARAIERAHSVSVLHRDLNWSPATAACPSS